MKGFLASAAVAAVLAASGVANATTVDWSFSGTNMGSGMMTYDSTTGLVSAFSGTYDGQTLAFVSLTADPNNSSAQVNYNGPELSTYQNVPNTGGANYTFDDLFPQTAASYAILASTGTGANEIVYELFYNGPSASDYMFFNIVTQPSYHYVEDAGTFTVSGAVPEPATWTMLGLGFAALGFAGYHKARAPRSLSL